MVVAVLAVVVAVIIAGVLYAMFKKKPEYGVSGGSSSPVLGKDVTLYVAAHRLPDGSIYCKYWGRAQHGMKVLENVTIRLRLAEKKDDYTPQLEVMEQEYLRPQLAVGVAPKLAVGELIIAHSKSYSDVEYAVQIMGVCDGVMYRGSELVVIS